MISEGPVIELDDSEVQTSIVSYMYITCILIELHVTKMFKNFRFLKT